MTTERSHAANWSLHMVQKHGALSTGHLFSAFSELGNTVKGDDHEERRSRFHDLLAADDRLQFDPEAKLWSVKRVEPEEDKGSGADLAQD